MSRTFGLDNDEFGRSLCEVCVDDGAIDLDDVTFDEDDVICAFETNQYGTPTATDVREVLAAARGRLAEMRGQNPATATVDHARGLWLADCARHGYTDTDDIERSVLRTAGCPMPAERDAEHYHWLRRSLDSLLCGAA